MREIGICEIYLRNSSSNTITSTKPDNLQCHPQAGWNLVSLPLVPENTSLDALVLASIEGNYSVLYTWIGSSWKMSTDPRYPLTEMNLGYGY
jgi:hypothetical protein